MKKSNILLCLHNTLQNNFVAPELSLLLTTNLPKTMLTISRAPESGPGMWVGLEIWGLEGRDCVIWKISQNNFICPLPGRSSEK